MKKFKYYLVLIPYLGLLYTIYTDFILKTREDDLRDKSMLISGLLGAHQGFWLLGLIIFIFKL